MQPFLPLLIGLTLSLWGPALVAAQEFPSPSPTTVRGYLSVPARPGGGATRSSTGQPDLSETVRAVLLRVELGFAAGNPSLVLESAGEQIEMDLGAGRRGIYSANQSCFLFEDFFRVCLPMAFSFERYGAGRQPFAVGQYEYMQREMTGRSRVFVSLTPTAAGGWQLGTIRIDPLVP